MPVRISNLADVDSRATLSDDVEIGPFCVVGPHVTIGERTQLDSHVTIVGHSTIGCGNRFFPGAVIGGEPQDFGYTGSPTRLEIGDDNLIREGVTINRGADKEDGCTRIGNRNMLMANSHVAHNCHIFNDVILVNGVLLGGHVHVHDGAIVSGNTVVHHFSTMGTTSFVSGGCRVTIDIPPYMLASGNDSLAIKTINLVGMRRRGISEATIKVIKRAHRLLYREHKPLDAICEILYEELDGVFPIEVTSLLNFVSQQQQGKFGRGRERFREQAPSADDARLARDQRRAA